jgi:N-acetyl-beta-hexosaminidase
LNLGSELTYNITREVIHEVSELFPFEFFHLGVDEVSYACYSTPEFKSKSQQFLHDHNVGVGLDIFEFFIDFAISEATQNHKTVIVWEELAMQTKFPIDKSKVIIEAWRAWGTPAYEKCVSIKKLCLINKQIII